ncbi:hypothetical protein [Blastococcus sp. CCUG 61487]|uniref:hypothetical protein n=1 Tax=Blastococcus sp. CCUG 61487 TaxID=1840703 RepID=UPI0010C0ED92|nr:hypothetical protein [Blastococcus sp. CCUG 61487]TKJ25206.1 hypothetical protein A6V29_04075 [Blastococcus sp. CCUG 61487]
MLNRLWTAAADALQYLRYAEPAALKARWAAVCGLIATVSPTAAGWLDMKVGVALAGLAVVGPWLQGKRTRADVWSQQTVDDLADLVALFPAAKAEATRLLGAGLSYRIVRDHIETQQAHAARSPEPS